MRGRPPDLLDTCPPELIAAHCRGRAKRWGSQNDYAETLIILTAKKPTPLPKIERYPL